MQPDPDTMQALPAQVQAALQEDLGAGDLTAGLVPATQRVRARLIAREAAVLCGQAWFNAVFAALDPVIAVRWHMPDGAALEPGSTVCELEGPARALLTGERTAMNFLQTLSGTATVTRAYVQAVAHTRCTVLDTRKTLPGLRLAQKYAVRCGGGHNHRRGLYDGILIKENHIAAAGGIRPAVQAALAQATAGVRLEVEVETLAQLDSALAAGATLILLDNFSLPGLAQAVRQTAGRARLEASGGFDLEQLREVAETGVDYVSVGALTKHLRAVDFSFRVY